VSGVNYFFSPHCDCHRIGMALSLLINGEL